MAAFYKPGDMVNGYVLSVDDVWVPMSAARANRWLGLDLGTWLALAAVAAGLAYVVVAVVVRADDGKIAQCQRLYDAMSAKISNPASTDAGDEYLEQRCADYFNDGKIR